MAKYTNPQFAALLIVGGVGVWYAGKKLDDAGDSIRQGAEQVLDGVNPASRNNFINRGAQVLIGKERLQAGFDRVFSTLGL